MPAEPTLEQLYGAADPEASKRFGVLLDEEAPDLVHQHALTPACSSELMRQAKLRGLPVVFTYHTPAVSCQRGTLMLWGTDPCDGALEVGRCTACTLQGLGAGWVESRLLARVPPVGGRWIGKSGASGGAWTALRMSSLITVRHQELRALFDLVDRFVVLAPWVARVLEINGVPDRKLTMCPHGITQPSTSSVEPRGDRATLRMAHLGRMDPMKGTALLIDAVRASPGANIALDIYGVVQHSSADALMEEFRRGAEQDQRINFLPAIPHGDVISTLATYDLVAIPSQLMETGPLVALEAFAAGVPVLGSALGGIADKVRDRVDGILVRPFNSVSAWSDALTDCVNDVEQVRRLRRSIQAPRSMTHVAAEMHNLYEQLVDTRLASLSASALRAGTV